MSDILRYFLRVIVASVALVVILAALAYVVHRYTEK